MKFVTLPELVDLSQVQSQVFCRCNYIEEFKTLLSESFLNAKFLSPEAFAKLKLQDKGVFFLSNDCKVNPDFNNLLVFLPWDGLQEFEDIRKSKANLKEKVEKL